VHERGKSVASAISATFVEPMLCLAVEKLPEGDGWQYEVKLDGYRAIGVRTREDAALLSRNRRDFSRRYPGVGAALTALPPETVIDGEVVALADDGRPSFSMLQNSGANTGRVVLYAFDLPILAGKDLRQAPLEVRREKLRQLVAALGDPIRYSETFDLPPSELMRVVRSNGLEGVVAKRLGSAYKPGDRSGDWVKVRANRAQDLVVGGFLPADNTFDSILVGYYSGRALMYASRIRSGFSAASRLKLFALFSKLLADNCPFRNLPDRTKGRWREGLTAEDMNKCRWLRPKLVATVEFLEWTAENRLRHPKFIGLRDDRRAREVTREP
jgi:bifunctional non-homologous end joining protein LigD